MLFRITFIIFVIIFVPAITSGQWRTSLLKAIIKEKQVGKSYIHKSVVDTTELTYLGVIIFPGTSSKFWVISEFSQTAAASTWHGHSNVYFLDSLAKEQWRIIFSFPGEFPHSISGQNFKFKREGKIVTVPFKIVGDNLFCLTNKECYEVVRE